MGGDTRDVGLCVREDGGGGVKVRLTCSPLPISPPSASHQEQGLLLSSGNCDFPTENSLLDIMAINFLVTWGRFYRFPIFFL